MSRTVTANTVYRVAITIPANTGNGSTLRSLIASATGGISTTALVAPTPTGDGSPLLNVKILGVDATGTSRAAFVVANTRQGASITATDFTTHGEYIAAGVDYYEPADGDFDSYVRSASASTITAIAVVYMN